MKKEKSDVKKKRSPLRKVVRGISYTVAVLLLLFILVVIFVRSPWGQDIIVNKVVSYVKDKTNTEVKIDRLFITFDGDISLEGLYLEDKKGDTLLYSKSLEADVPLWPIIRGNGVGVEELDWSGVRANIYRKDSISGYNFQFLIDAFAATDTTTTTSDSTAAPMDIIIGDIRLHDFNVNFDDAVLGIQSSYVFNTLEVGMEAFNLEEMRFEANDVFLEDTEINVVQTQDPPPPTGEPVPLPILAAENIQLKNVKGVFNSYPANLTATASLGVLSVEDGFLHLPNQEIKVAKVALNQSNATLALEEPSNPVDEKETVADATAFSWPDWEVAVEEIDLQQNNFEFYNGPERPQQGVFNANAIAVRDLLLKANDISLQDETATLNLENMYFAEASGLNIERLTGNITVSNTEANLDNFQFKGNGNSINASATLQYASLDTFIKQPENTTIDLSVPSFSVETATAYYFQPDLRSNSTITALAKKPISGSLSASGTLDNIAAPNLTVRWGSTTSLQARAQIRNVMDPDRLQFDVPILVAKTLKQDVEQFVALAENNLEIPNQATVQGSVSGTLSNIQADLDLKSSQGTIAVEGSFQQGDRIQFDADVAVQEYELGTLLKDSIMGPLTLKVKAKGSGTTINTLDAELQATVESFQYNSYNINDLNIDGTITDGSGNITSKYKDENINAALDAFVVLDSVSSKADIVLDVEGMKLQPFGITRRDVRTGFTLRASGQGNADAYEVEADIEEGVVVYDNSTYLLGDIQAKAFVRPDTTYVRVDNRMVDVELQSNSSPQQFTSALTQNFERYFFEETRVDTITNPVKLKVAAHIRQAPVMQQVFLDNLRDLDTIDIAVDFDEAKRTLTSTIYAPHINYNGNELDSLRLDFNGDAYTFNFNLGFNQLKAGPLALPKTDFSGDFADKQLDLTFLAKEDDSTLFDIRSQITGSRERLRYHVVPDPLIFNGNNWQTPSSNEVIYAEDRLTFNDFRFENGRQQVAVRDGKTANGEDEVGLYFESFSLETLLSYFNPDTTLAEGTLNGSLVLEDPLHSTGVVADLDVQQFSVLEESFGTLSLNAEAIGTNEYTFNLQTEGGDADLTLDGSYTATENEALLDMDLQLQRIDMRVVDGLSLGELKNGSGTISGNISIDGTIKEPIYEGEVNFNQAKVTVSRFNAPFTMPNETIQLNNERIALSNFKILDANDNALTTDGTIGTENLLNPTFDLSIKAKDFQLIDATEEDNDMIYGKANISADATVKGDMVLPIIKGELTVSPDTDITYVLPSATVNVEERDGVVQFVNKENPDAILTQTEEETATIDGIDLQANLKVTEGAVAKIVIDKQTGDHLEVKGKGDFVFNIRPNGRTTLSGRYTLTDGHYETNLYNLVKRRFEIAEGSTVTWSGNLFDAELDIRAVYDIETSARALMAPAVSSANPTVQNQFRQKLPFLVYLNIDGQLTEPTISFQLDMPEDEQGALGGQVYGRIQQVNQQEQTLNKQVFSLLVLNKFYPEPGSDGSRGGLATVARDNLNDALSDQLDVFSNRLLGDSGFELDFDLDSYTDYQGTSPQQRTQLEIAAQKRFFDDRFIVKVGSNVDVEGSSQTGETTPIIGNVTLEYLLTEEGRYRLKGFRRSEFQNVIDGQTIVSGIALIFTQEFNQFTELWDAMFSSQNPSEEEQNESEQNSNDDAREETNE
ncbi:translocation/assembly module TamB domain-containing protein [Flavobacteriaceae bacterium TK19130]|nr:translocation/assembly module TamB domain-containing protein [Thermobacterium salinum]